MLKEAHKLFGSNRKTRAVEHSRLLTRKGYILAHTHILR